LEDTDDNGRLIIQFGRTGIAPWYSDRVLAGRPGFNSRQGQALFSILKRPDWLCDTTSYPVGTGGPFPTVTRPGLEADLSPPSSAKIKNITTLSPLLHTSSCRGA
jgi:hypothetical protein